MATQAGEKSTGKRMFWIAVMCPFRTMDSPPWSSRVAASDSLFPQEAVELGLGRAHSVSLIGHRFDHHFVDVTPSPVLARLERPNNRVMGFSKMLRGVFVLRGVTAADMAARLAQPQMDPRVTPLQALLASVGVRRHIVHLVQVRTRLWHHAPTIPARVGFSAA